VRTVHELRPTHDPEKRVHRSFIEYAEMAAKRGLSVLGNGPVMFAGNVHDPELMAHQLANACMVQLFDASGLAPGEMRDKVLAFQDEVRTVIVHHLKEARRYEQRRIGLLLEAQGHSQAASLIRE
jgi:hypothetical protein